MRFWGFTWQVQKWIQVRNGAFYESIQALVVFPVRMLIILKGAPGMAWVVIRVPHGVVKVIDPSEFLSYSTSGICDACCLGTNLRTYNPYKNSIFIYIFIFFYNFEDL